MKVLKTANYKKFIKAQFDRIRTQEDLAAEQTTAITFEIESYLQERLEENPNMTAQEMFQSAKYEFIDDGDYETAPDYATMTEGLIIPAIEKVKQEYEAHLVEQDADDQAAYDVEMSRDTYQQHGDGYQPLEDTSPCKDKITRERTESENPGDHTFNYYPNVEKTNHFSPIL
jgi:hypothetical protein